MNTVRTCLLLLGALAIPVAPAATLSVSDPVYAPRSGVTIGWDFTIENYTDYLVVEASDICATGVSSPCTLALGTYTDFIGPNFIVVGPAPDQPAVSEVFDYGGMTGLGAFQITQPATPGTTVVTAIVTYSLYSRSPNDPLFSYDDLISSGNVLTASSRITVASTPEPASLWTVLAGIAAGFLLSRKRKQARDSHAVWHDGL